MTSGMMLPALTMLTLVHILMSISLSKEIYDWVPTFGKRIALFICVWCAPVIGLIVVYRVLDLDWLGKKRGKTSSGQSSVGSVFLGLDSVFNPGSKHVVEAKQKETIEQAEEGDLYSPDNPELVLSGKPDDKG
jgi:hypothetical protein